MVRPARAKDARTALEFVTVFTEMRWPHTTAKTRDGTSDALTTILPSPTKKRPAAPTPRLRGGHRDVANERIDDEPTA